MIMKQNQLTTLQRYHALYLDHEQLEQLYETGCSPMGIHSQWSLLFGVPVFAEVH